MRERGVSGTHIIRQSVMINDIKKEKERERERERRKSKRGRKER